MQHVSDVHITVAKENAHARKLYAKTGFVICGEADMYGNSFFLLKRFLNSKGENNIREEVGIRWKTGGDPGRCGRCAAIEGRDYTKAMQIGRNDVLFRIPKTHLVSYQII